MEGAPAATKAILLTSSSQELGLQIIPAKVPIDEIGGLEPTAQAAMDLAAQEEMALFRRFQQIMKSSQVPEPEKTLKQEVPGSTMGNQGVRVPSTKAAQPKSHTGFLDNILQGMTATRGAIPKTPEPGKSTLAAGSERADSSQFSTVLPAESMRGLTEDTQSSEEFAGAGYLREQGC